MLVHKNEKVDVKAQKILCPQVKDLDHDSTYFVKDFVFCRSASHATTGVGELGYWKPGSNKNVRKEYKRILQDFSCKMLLHIFTNQVIVVASSRKCQQSEEHVFVHKRSRQDSFI